MQRVEGPRVANDPWGSPLTPANSMRIGTVQGRTVPILQEPLPGLARGGSDSPTSSGRQVHVAPGRRPDETVPNWHRGIRRAQSARRRLPGTTLPGRRRPPSLGPMHRPGRRGPRAQDQLLMQTVHPPRHQPLRGCRRSGEDRGTRTRAQQVDGSLKRHDQSPRGLRLIAGGRTQLLPRPRSATHQRTPIPLDFRISRVSRSCVPQVPQGFTSNAINPVKH